MPVVDALGRAERQADAVQAQRIVAADGAELRQRRAAAHVILGMHLEPAEGGAGGNDLRDMRRAQPDADRRECRIMVAHDHRDPPRRSRRQAFLGVRLAPWIFWQVPVGT